MENLKIKVNNKAEGREAQELFFELGFQWFNRGKVILPMCGFSYIGVSLSSGFLGIGSGENNHKEITLPELRDMVILKRNNVGDYTHGSSFGSRFYHCCNGDVYAFNDGTWVFDHTKVLKPIGKKEMKEYLLKTENGTHYYHNDSHDECPKYVEKIEIPEGAEKLTACGMELIFWTACGNYSWHTENSVEWDNNKELGLTSFDQYFDNETVILWQRETLNDQVASTEEFKQPEDLPFLDNGVDIGVENLPDFTPEFPSEKEIKTDFPLNRGDVNYRVAKAFNEIRRTDLTEDDLDFIRKLIDLTVSHYTDRF